MGPQGPTMSFPTLIKYALPVKRIPKKTVPAASYQILNQVSFISLPACEIIHTSQSYPLVGNKGQLILTFL